MLWSGRGLAVVSVCAYYMALAGVAVAGVDIAVCWRGVPGTWTSKCRGGGVFIFNCSA